VQLGRASLGRRRGRGTRTLNADGVGGMRNAGCGTGWLTREAEGNAKAQRGRGKRDADAQRGGNRTARYRTALGSAQETLACLPCEQPASSWEH
jgi:hypothetical protein